jgi:hypothetical protein
MQEQVNASRVDFQEEAHRTSKASAEAIDRPSHHSVNFPPHGRDGYLSVE